MTKSRSIVSRVKASPGSIDKDTGMHHPVSSEQRCHYVEVAAYYLAEKRGFAAGANDDDWTQAELEIDRLLAEGQINR